MKPNNNQQEKQLSNWTNKWIQKKMTGRCIAELKEIINNGAYHLDLNQQKIKVNPSSVTKSDTKQDSIVDNNAHNIMTSANDTKTADKPSGLKNPEGLNSQIEELEKELEIQRKEVLFKEGEEVGIEEAVKRISNSAEALGISKGKLETLKQSKQLFEDVFEKLKANAIFRDCGKCGHESYAKFITEEDIDKIKGEVLG